jgi:iron complex transport system substrate-binding protein
VWQDIRRVAEVFQVDPQPLLQELKLRIDSCDCHRQLPPDRIPTVAAIEWTEPLMIAGNWIPELIELAGGKPVLSATQNSSYIEWSALLEANPDVIIIMPCGFDLERTRIETEALTQHPHWQELRAVQHQQVYITDGNAYFNRPGPRLVDSIEIIAEILHSELYNFAYQHEAWEIFV